MVIEFPPVQADLFRLVDRADQQTYPNRQQLDFRQRNLDVPRHDQALVEDPIEHVDQTARSVPLGHWHRHRFAILAVSSGRCPPTGRETGLSQQWRCHGRTGAIWYGTTSAALYSVSRSRHDVAECYRDKSSAGASTSQSAGPRSAAETFSNPKPYRARQIAVDAARAVRQSIIESSTSTVADAGTPAARDRC